MFEKIRKKAGRLQKAGKGQEEHRCVICMRNLGDPGVSGWIRILRTNDELAYICTSESTADKEKGCTPESAYAHLSSFVVGQEYAKKVISVAVYNHWKRIKMAQEGGGDIPVEKSNILLIGPTGTGKTMLAKAAAGILDVPFISINATALTEADFDGVILRTDFNQYLAEVAVKREGKAAIGFRAAGEERVAVFKKARACEITNKDLEKYGIIPELAGRLPVKAVLNPLGKKELASILTEPENALIKQYQMLLAADGVELSCTEGALEKIAEQALEEKAGARGLRAIIEGIMLETMFRAPGGKGHVSLVLTADDIDGITRPEERLVWDETKKQAKGAVADDGAGTIKEDKKKAGTYCGI